jgi:diguanylate cyclase
MISERPYRSYRKSMSREEAITEIKNNSGTQFDPKLSQIFIEKVMHKPW